MDFPYRGEIYSISCALLWAMAVVLFKQSSERMHPMGLNLFKSCVGLVLMVPTILILGESFLPSLSGKDIILLTLSGVIGRSIAAPLFLRCLQLLGAGRSQIVACLYSPLVILFSTLFLSERLSRGDLGGTILILSGVLLTVERNRDKAAHGKQLRGVMIGALAFACMALGVVLVKPVLGRAPLLWSTTYRLLVGIVGLLIMVPLSRNGREIMRSLHPSPAWRAAIIGSVFGTYLAMIMWLAGIKYTSASSAAILNQSSAVFALPLAAIFLHEAITRRKALALLLAVAGVVWVTLR